MSSLFKSEAGRAEIYELYDQKVAALDMVPESLYVETSFGRTHILRAGSPDAPALILVHGSNGCAPIALECYPNLSKSYQVFAVDVVAQPNKSAESVLSMKDDSYGQWMHEIIEQLKIEDVVLAGFSLGGLIILKTLIHRPERIKEAYLASPAYLVNGNPLRALFKIFIPMRRYMKTHDGKYIERFLSVLFTERDSFAVQFLSKVFLHFTMDFNPVPVMTKKEAQSIRTPITILGAGRDILFPGQKMKKRAQKHLSSLRCFVLLEDSKHVQDHRGNRIFEEMIMEAQ